MKSLPWPRLLALASFGFALTLITNTLDPAIYGHKVLELAPERPNTLLGFSTAAGSVLSILLAPLVGALSDRTRSSWGRRIPFFVIGIPVLFTALFSIGFAPSAIFFLLGVLLYRVGDNLIFPAWEALYPDQVPIQQRGLASGMKSAMDIFAVLVGRFAAGELMARAAENGDRALWLAISIPAIGLLLALAITWVALRGLPQPKTSATVNSALSLATIFRFDWRKHRVFIWWLVNRFLFWTGFVILGTFLLFFVIDVIGLAEADAQRYLARLSLVLGGAILIVAIPAGRLADRIGRRPLVIAACALAAVGTGLIVFLRDLNGLAVAAALIGLGSGIYNSANFALLTDIVPAREAGRFLGLSNMAGAGGGALARFLGAVLIDPINALSDDRSTGYLTLYALAAILFGLSTWAALRLSAEQIQKPSSPPRKNRLN